MLIPNAWRKKCYLVELCLRIHAFLYRALGPEITHNIRAHGIGSL